MASLAVPESLIEFNAPEKSMIDTCAVSLSSVFSNLTTNQAEAIAAALELGYYQVPKKMTTEELAQKQKVPRTTYEEHLRKAERFCMRSPLTKYSTHTNQLDFKKHPSNY